MKKFILPWIVPIALFVFANCSTENPVGEAVPNHNLNFKKGLFIEQRDPFIPVTINYTRPVHLHEETRHASLIGYIRE